MIKPTNINIADDLYTFDVYKVYLIDPVTGIELYTESVTDTNLQFKEDSKEIKAGVGNKLLLDIPSSKSIIIELTDVKTRLDWIAAKQGTTVEKKATVAWHLPKNYVAEAGDEAGVKVTLAETPKTPTAVRCLKIDAATGVSTELTGTVEGKIIKIAKDVAVGDTIFVTGYQYEAAATTNVIDLNTEKFSSAYNCVVEGVVFNGSRKPVYKKQYIFDKVTMDGNSEDSTKSERDAQQSKTTLKVQLPAGKDSLGKLLYIPMA